MTERVLFVHAHPDDETISTGATIATLLQRGANVAVLTCTRGERGEVIPADLAHLLESPETLGDYREKELAAAMTALGVTDHRMLGNANARWPGRAPRRYFDSGMRWDASGAAVALDDTDVESLTAAELAEVSADIAAVLIQWQPDVVVSYDANGGYGHPDHIRVHDATRAAAEVIGVPFYAVEPSGATASLTVDAAAVAPHKRAALTAYRTQLTVDDNTFSLSSGGPRPIDAPEYFGRFRAAPAGFASHSLPSSLFSCVLALVIGAYAGLALTVANQATVQLAGASIPWGLIAGILIVIGLLVGLRLVFETRVVPAAAAAGLIAASAILALPSPGGTVLVPASAAGYILAFAPVLIAIVILGWPRRRQEPGQTPRRRAPKDKIEEVLPVKGSDFS